MQVTRRSFLVTAAAAAASAPAFLGATDKAGSKTDPNPSRGAAPYESPDGSPG